MSPLHVAQTFWDLLLVIAILVGLGNQKRLAEWENKLFSRVKAIFTKEGRREED